MGLLVGNTTVIEHSGTYVEYSRTYSHEKYSPEKVSIGFVLPKEMSLSDGYLLARAVVNAQLGLKVRNAKKADMLCQLVFDQELVDFYQEPEIGPKHSITVPSLKGRSRTQIAHLLGYDDYVPVDSDDM